MTGQREQWNYLFEILRYGLGEGGYPQICKSADWSYLYNLCKAHKIEAVVYYSLERMIKEAEKQNLQQPEIPEEILKNLCQSRQLEVARDMVQHYSQEELLAAFENAGIYCLPLKGILLKECYPQPALRMMADLDILYRGEHARMEAIMTELGYYCDHRGSHHDVYFKKPFMNIEMHHCIVEPDSKAALYYQAPWEKAVPVEGKQYVCRYSREDFYIFVIVHMAKHFQYGGCGIRSVLDLWQFWKKAQKDGGADRDYIDAELEKLGLKQFEHHVMRLVRIWFEEDAGNEFYDQMTELMINSGIYGTMDNYWVQNVAASGRTVWMGQVKVWMEAIFLPLPIIRQQYPYLEKFPFLLPAAWVQRILRTCFHRKGRAGQVLSGRKVDAGKARDRGEMFERLGLK